MKTPAVLFLLGLCALPALAQELGPSPTESIGCEPHGDHWHCEGPRPPSTSSAPPPVVTATAAPEPTTTAAGDGDDDEGTEHTDAPGTGSLEPSPTESIGCEPHGDHWHCEGPRPPAETGSETSVTTLPTLATTTGAASGTEAFPATTSSSSVITAGAAAGPMVGAAPVLGLAAFAALGL
ncbi:hypothetical protein MMYC01_206704 [Madurella mycetomatis]|uniref:Uncharacterized protein n=1 Tax=Madurella mycetomatis TaxID=100816 RepID=A0A175W1X1_9PEZI|nr:hypothetical protein MMYC01_208018 [Madurella mycetomatis]KXX77757.1 hypothetical protein MMYC01_206704 [Madurella mycetomatis]